MRNKIKQLLKKEGGFTLVELLAVLAILALIVGISIPLIGNVISSSKTKAVAAQTELIIDAAQFYETQTGNKIVATGINVSVLVEAGYLEADSNYTGVTVQKDAKGQFTVTGLKTTENATP